MANPARIAINGFGRIGRLFLRQVLDLPAEHRNFEIVAINDLGNLENLAYLLRYDSVYGRYHKSVKTEGSNLVVDGKPIRVYQIKEPTQLPWGELNIDIVVEATGIFESYEKAKVHLRAGAKRVVLTAPAKDPDGTEGKTVLVGVNDGDLKSAVITSNGSCTTNAASPVIQILSENPGIAKAILNTVHAYTATQGMVDGAVRGGSDFRRGRAGAHNIIPSTTGSAIAVGRAMPEMKGKFDGIALRVPVVAASIADITFVSKRRTSVEEINAILTKAAESERWRGILAVTNDKIVSSDIIGQPYGAIVDLNFTKVIDGDLVKVLSWYENEWGYVSTLMRHLMQVVAVL